MTADTPFDSLLDSLRERAKELSCLYQVEEILERKGCSDGELMEAIVRVLPSGWARPDLCRVQIRLEGEVWQSSGFVDRPPILFADVLVQDKVVGRVSVAYGGEFESAAPPFLGEERRLLDTVALRIGQTLLHRSLGPVFRELSLLRSEASGGSRSWQSVVDMLRITDPDLYLLVSRRMLNHLCSVGVAEAKALLEQISEGLKGGSNGEHDGINRPMRRLSAKPTRPNADRIVEIAGRHLSDDMILSHIQRWLTEHKVNYLVTVLEDNSANLADLVDAITRFKESGVSENELSQSLLRAIRVSLIRRFFSRRLEFIRLAKQLVTLDDFYDLTRRLIYPTSSHGHLGGKSAGLFMAMQVVADMAQEHSVLAGIKVPKTWYVASDAVVDFLHYNHLEELLEHKYRPIEHVRNEYPNIVALFKNSSFSPSMIRSLSLALDDLGDKPLVVRSSSLLEDSAGAAFSGKYKSLFLANQGTKQERLAALQDAIAEVYASMFGPDPIQYRAERELLDFPEEMGIMIQEVVGSRVGDYLLPAFGGVAFGNNEFRWSPRIRRKDGLCRLVPGLGTRAVDRLSNDYPILVAPGQPGLRVNAAVDEVVRYAPRYADVINLRTNSIETVEVAHLLKVAGRSYPRFRQVFSIIREGVILPPNAMTDPDAEQMVVSFDGLLRDTSFVAQIRTLLHVLEGHYGMAVDIEFAADGQDFYLLQCRAQSSLQDRTSVTLPREVSPEQIVFTANRYVSDGYVAEITQVVYVVPEQYDRINDMSRLKAVGQAVGRLNGILPKRKFVLIGPGRWGSRGDIKLGVSVTYSDINETAALIEVAFKKGNYLPDLSFGTHFFQDLVEASILYLPLYPDDPDVRFNEEWLLTSRNALVDFLPEAESLADVVRVIDVAQATGGRTLRIFMDGDAGKAMALLVSRD